MDTPQILEGLMLVCFGAAWPFSILKMWRVRRTEGKSAVFIAVVLCGYVFGLAAKLLASARAGVPLPPICFLYGFNALLVSIDLAMYLRFSPRGRLASGTTSVE